MAKLLDKIKQLINNDSETKAFLAKKLAISEEQISIENYKPNRNCEKWEIITLKTKGTFKKRLQVLNKKIAEIDDFNTRIKNVFKSYNYVWEITTQNKYSVRRYAGLGEDSLEKIVKFFEKNGLDFMTEYSEEELHSLNK